MNSNSYKSSEEYIFINWIRKIWEKKGYLERIKEYEELKKQHKILREAYKNKNSTDKSFEEFKKEFLEKEKNAKKKMKIVIYFKKLFIMIKIKRNDLV